MIEQRNISLISNRMHTQGGRRIPEAVIERDYCLAWFLLGLSESSIKKHLAFKGGTALRRCYFQHYRFSEDLDFTLVKEISLEEIINAFKKIFAYVNQETGIVFELGKQESPTKTTYTFYITYIGPLPGKEKEVKVDITFREKMIFPTEQKIIIKTYEEYSDFPKNSHLTVYSLNEVIIEKVCALLSPARNEPRDLYDIHHLIQVVGADLTHLIQGIEAKLKFKGRSLKESCGEFEKKETRLKNLWQKRLSGQMVSLPEFNDTFRVVKRSLRKAGLLAR